MPPVLSIPLLSYEERTENGNGLHMLYSSSLDSYGSLSMGDTDYGSLSSYSSKLLPPPSTLEMIVPAHAVGKVMGKGGANIDNICKLVCFPTGHFGWRNSSADETSFDHCECEEGQE
ncbi:KH domain-containing protein At4g18375-like isoform X3 [Diospyros lotus]|uniref:KH domain-containing protein At4g18375-like isoform X3 n=1 Tax=Diospyros lotus TaxID=55363 RepID=UPI00224F6D45|nr:KH domain-containing protein At4g18375-like isoform X3 [Diospyros lotus]XP_052186826.1 KH domain-containing protein At4g18375-like isoform X3 [Diospyros lotus]